MKQKKTMPEWLRGHVWAPRNEWSDGCTPEKRAWCLLENLGFVRQINAMLYVWLRDYGFEAREGGLSKADLKDLHRIQSLLDRIFGRLEERAGRTQDSAYDVAYREGFMRGRRSNEGASE